MPRPNTLLLALATLLLGMSGGCGRWMDYAPLRLNGQIGDHRLVYQRLLRRSLAMGYQVTAPDPTRSYFMVRAHLDQHNRKAWRMSSYFHVMVHPGGDVDVSVSGFHVRDSGTKIHRRLCNELTLYLDGLSQELHMNPRVVALSR